MTETPLRLTGESRVAPTADELYDHLAMALMGAARRAVVDRGVFHLALSGGSTPEPFYMRLVTDPRFRAIPWQQTHLWIVDERRVPEDDPQSNYRMIRETLLEHVPMKGRQKHPMPALADDAAARYEAELRRVIGPPAVRITTGPQTPRLDFVLLGMGDDGHTASLFPHSPALEARDRLVAGNEGEHVTPPPRLTMTFALLNAACALAVLVAGERKRATLRRVSDQLATAGPDVQGLPITGLKPLHADGTLTWFLDADAAGR